MGYYNASETFYVVTGHDGKSLGYMSYGKTNGIAACLKTLKDGTHFEDKKDAKKFKNWCEKTWNATFKIITADGTTTTKHNVIESC